MPYYLAIGMPAEEYWCGDVFLTETYRRAHDLRRQRKSEEMWLQGLYNFRAFSTALSNLNFSGKPKRLNRYIDEPFRIIPLTEEEKAAKAEKERQKTIDYFNRLAEKFAKREK